MEIKKWFKNQDYWLKYVWPAFIFLAGLFLTGQIEKVKTAYEKIVATHAAVEKLNGHLESSLKDGVAIKVGVNSKELRGNQALVFGDGVVGLKLAHGDTISLSKISDHEGFQTTINVDILPLRKESTENNSEAKIFISKIAADKLGIGKVQGIEELKVRIVRQSRSVENKTSQ